MRKKEFKNQYKYIFNQLRTILNEIDPEGLSPDRTEGAPVSEYDQEIAQILNYLEHNMESIKLNHLCLVNYINQLWNDSFGRQCKGVNKIADYILSNIV